MRIIVVTGSRDWTDAQTVERNIADAAEGISPSDVALMHGQCPTGADKIADDYADRNGYQLIRLPAPWGVFGNYAGPQRNDVMAAVAIALAADGHEVEVLAFQLNGSRGTGNAIKAMNRNGFMVHITEATS